MWFEIILLYLPVVFLLGYTLKTSFNRSLASTNIYLTVLFALAITIAIGYFPLELSIDKPRYAYMYTSALDLGISYEYRDMGWIAYNTICGWIFGKKMELFFLLTAIIYVGGFLVLSRMTFPKEYMGYFVIMSVGCLGFSNYGTNVIRAGVAMSLLMLAYSLKIKNVYKILLVLIALTFQKSMIIPILAFIGGSIIKKTPMVVFIWGVCLLLSATNVDLSALFESVGFVDERIEQYTDTMDDLDDSSYEQGFRLDFFLYSVFPLLIAFYYNSMKRIKDEAYLILVKTYLLANAVWLLAIRIEYSDRLAYLSWFMIPYILLYPIIKYQHKFLRPQRVMLMLMYIFMGVRVMLALRSAL